MSSRMGVAIIVYSVGWMAIACMDSRRLKDSHDTQHQLGLVKCAMNFLLGTSQCAPLMSFSDALCYDCSLKLDARSVLTAVNSLGPRVPSIAPGHGPMLAESTSACCHRSVLTTLLKASGLELHVGVEPHTIATGHGPMLVSVPRNAAHILLYTCELISPR